MSMSNPLLSASKSKNPAPVRVLPAPTRVKVPHPLQYDAYLASRYHRSPHSVRVSLRQTLVRARAPHICCSPGNDLTLACGNNPDQFLKDGKLDPSVQDPTVASFGFGRRICPGRFLSDAGLFASITHVLTVFDIKPSLDENGNEIKIIPRMTDGLLSYPEAFECRIVPRSKEAEQLIQNLALMS